jgi:hypothetical protein
MPKYKLHLNVAPNWTAPPVSRLSRRSSSRDREVSLHQVEGRFDLAVSDLGRTQFKNVAEPIRVYLLEVGNLRKRSR